MRRLECHECLQDAAIHLLGKAGPDSAALIAAATEWEPALHLHLHHDRAASLQLIASLRRTALVVVPSLVQNAVCNDC